MNQTALEIKHLTDSELLWNYQKFLSLTPIYLLPESIFGTFPTGSCSFAIWFYVDKQLTISRWFFEHLFLRFHW